MSLKNKSSLASQSPGNKNSIEREFSSGGVVFKKESKHTLWLVRKTAPSEIYSETFWMLPKGWIDDEAGGRPGPMASGKVRADVTSLENAALREVSEEGGIEARIVKKIGTIKYTFTHPIRGNIMKFVTFFLMEWKKDLQDGYGEETTEIRWLPFEEAYKTLSFSGEKQTLKKAKEILASLAQRIE